MRKRNKLDLKKDRKTHQFILSLELKLVNPYLKSLFDSLIVPSTQHKRLCITLIPSY